MKAEFKIAGSQTWEHTPIHSTPTYTGQPGGEEEHFNTLARKLSAETGRQVRWNYAGKDQGRYVDASRKLMLTSA